MQLLHAREVLNNQRSGVDGLLAERVDQPFRQLADVAFRVALLLGLPLDPLSEEKGEGLLGLFETESEIADNRRGAAAGEPDECRRREQRAVPVRSRAAEGRGQAARRLEFQEGVDHHSAPPEELRQHRRQHHHPGELDDQGGKEALAHATRYKRDQRHEGGDPEHHPNAAQQHGPPRVGRIEAIVDRNADEHRCHNVDGEAVDAVHRQEGQQDGDLGDRGGRAERLPQGHDGEQEQKPRSDGLAPPEEPLRHPLATDAAHRPEGRGAGPFQPSAPAPPRPQSRGENCRHQHQPRKGGADCEQVAGHLRHVVDLVPARYEVIAGHQ